MRAWSEANGIAVKAYAGTTGVLLALNLSDDARRGLLGFAIERRAGREREWLRGLLPFPWMRHRPGALIESSVAPIQRFRWSDYRVHPDRTYVYRVHPVYGSSRRPELESGPEVTVRTASSRRGRHVIVFNRAAAASQAFSRKFPEVEQAIDAARRAREPLPPLPREALTWLSRGVDEQIARFIEEAPDGRFALDIAIYEYELDEIVAAVEAAHRRGVHVRVVYHARGPDDPQTQANERALAGLPESVKRPRFTTKLCHHKFIVLSRIEDGVRRPRAVLCGSTNFTHNGVYRQANVVHVVRLPKVASGYLALFGVLWRGDTPRETRRYVDDANPLVPDESFSLGFSPRSGRLDLETFVAAVDAARDDVLFCTTFNLYDPLEQALLGAPHDAVLRLGLENRRSRITGFHRDRTADFSATAMLSQGLEGFLKESTKGQRGNILVHTKLIVIDFTSDAPTVISGSHNYSVAASEGNDENYFIVRGNTDVADCYGVELMRLYEHYRFRWAVKTGRPTGPPGRRGLLLAEDDSWTDRYFEPGSLEEADRLRFASAPGSA
jgi:phosphatidylserine/phosphatidylglycerophosphate/cardiolipin synthase-like enzyme